MFVITMKTLLSYHSEITGVVTPWHWQDFGTVKVWGQSKRDTERQGEGEGKNEREERSYQVLGNQCFPIYISDV